MPFSRLSSRSGGANLDSAGARSIRFTQWRDTMMRCNYDGLFHHKSIQHRLHSPSTHLESKWKGNRKWGYDTLPRSTELNFPGIRPHLGECSENGSAGAWSCWPWSWECAPRRRMPVTMQCPTSSSLAAIGHTTIVVFRSNRSIRALALPRQRL